MSEAERRRGGVPAGRVGRPARRWALLVEMARFFATSLDEDAVVQTVVERLGAVLGGSAMLTFAQPDGSLRIAALYHPDPAIAAEHEAIFRAIPPREGLGIVGAVAQSGEAMRVTEVEGLTAEQRVYFDAAGLRATLSAPLRTPGRILGVLSVAQLKSAAARPLAEQDLELVSALAGQAALAIEHARLQGAGLRDRAFYQVLLQGSPAGVILYDREQRVLEANDAFLRLTGRPRDEVTGRLVTDVLPDRLYRDSPLAAEIGRALAGETLPRREVVLESPTGQTHWDLHHSAIQGEDGSVLAGLAAIREITDRVKDQRRVEALAREAAARFSQLRAVIDAIGEGVFVCDRTGWLTLINEAGAQMNGLPLGQALQPIDTYGELLNIRYPDGRPMPSQEFPLVRALRGEISTNSEQLVHRPDTDTDELRCVAFAPIREAVGGEITGAVAVVSDITELRRLERQREEFLSVASHELRTPVASIKGYAQVLLRAQRRGALDEERLAQTLTTIDRETTRLTSLIADMLDVSRIRTGRLGLDRVRLDVIELIRELLDQFTGRLDGRHWIEVELPEEPAWLHGDRERLRQILQNLLSNALKYSPEGGFLRVEARAEPENVYVSVADQGIGIPAEAEGRLFEPYARASNASLRNYGGLGLGLYISRTLAEQHGGELTVSSAGQNQGATFTLCLPLDLPSSAQAEDVRGHTWRTL